MVDSVEPTQNPLWIYALSVYSRSGVEALLLKMQDEHGADILQLLTVLWLSEQGLEVDEASLSDSDYVSWKQEMIEPLRQRRRQSDRLEHGDLYELLKKAELEAERYGLGILWARNKDNPADKGRCVSSDLMLICNNEKECKALADLVRG
ncbi:MAG: TIGR02444 family protein [Pseudomonadota bacterium]|nr:hypothetical protein A3746_18150 [Oleibacter sp. HI0075]KZZ10725.1 hypothetical protein A3746_14635 [Oleibacter sp. HI0075]MAE89647.1 DUF2390 domain-containing protein [Pelagibaca sp.]MED5441670.1 TIGR02444 family protein [Pseudomonadota bacterium]|tara:strand:- start:3577 stop:4026 length:450 start_codon:yes stop_codon:yes gene_type:complete